MIYLYTLVIFLCIPIHASHCPAAAASSSSASTPSLDHELTHSGLSLNPLITHFPAGRRYADTLMTPRTATGTHAIFFLNPESENPQKDRLALDLNPHHPHRLLLGMGGFPCAPTQWALDVPQSCTHIKFYVDDTSKPLKADSFVYIKFDDHANKDHITRLDIDTLMEHSRTQIFFDAREYKGTIYITTHNDTWPGVLETERFARVGDGKLILYIEHLNPDGSVTHYSHTDLPAGIKGSCAIRDQIDPSDEALSWIPSKA